MERATITQCVHSTLDQIWSVVLSNELPDPEEVTGALPATPAGNQTSIFITGAWSGSVTLTASDSLTRQIADTIFAGSPDPLTDEDMIDAMQELVNILGGNLKTRLPEPNALSIPAFKKIDMDDASLLEDDALIRFSYRCGDEPLIITVRKE